jgi:hypothetical protein
MGLMRELAREYMLHRLGGGHRRRRGYRGRHPRYGGYRYRPRHRPYRRTRVHVGGCCLPIPLGVLLGSTFMARRLVNRRRR